MDNSFNNLFPKKIVDLIEKIYEKLISLAKFSFNDYKSLEKKLYLIEEYINNIIVSTNSIQTAPTTKNKFNKDIKPQKTKITKKLDSFNKTEYEKKINNKLNYEIFLNMKLGDKNYYPNNKYIINKLRRKIKEQQETNKIRELKYLEKLIVLENKVKKYEDKHFPISTDSNLNNDNDNNEQKKCGQSNNEENYKNISLEKFQNNDKKKIFFINTTPSISHKTLNIKNRSNKSLSKPKTQNYDNFNTYQTSEEFLNQDPSKLSISLDPINRKNKTNTNFHNNLDDSRIVKNINRIKNIKNNYISLCNLDIYKEYRDRIKNKKKCMWRHDFNEIVKSVEDGQKKIIQFKNYFAPSDTKSKAQQLLLIHHNSINFY